MKSLYGTDAMPETAENVAAEYRVSRIDQDTFALASQRKARAAQARGEFDAEIVPVSVPVSVPQANGELIVVGRDEHLRETSAEKLAQLPGVVRPDGSVTAGNSSGINDGACALIVASEAAARTHGLTPRARVVGAAVAGVAPRVMGIGPAPATQKLLARCGVALDAIDVIELNEAFAAQALATLRLLGVRDDDARVNPNGGAIALGHPLGMSGARLAATATAQLHRHRGRYALATMCIGVGQGIALLLERI
jgi:acetyl-CoA acetyltransferase family protein